MTPDPALTPDAAEPADPGPPAAEAAAESPEAPKLTCPNCGADDLLLESGSRFCEQCGYQVDEPVTGEEELAVQAGPKPCASCDGTEFDAEGYCIGCGDLQPRRRDRMEVDLTLVAGISDRGRRHHRNEDSMALRPTAAPGNRNAVVAVVCDGVSTSERPDEASAAAVSAAAKWLLTAITSGTSDPEPAPVRTGPVETAVLATVVPASAAGGAVSADAQDDAVQEAGAEAAAGAEAVAGTAAGAARRALGPEELSELSRQAVREADRAVSDLEREADHGNPPACTYVSAVVGTDVTVAWLGDSRAYWLDERGTSRALTRDDAAEGSHAIEAWLGADSGDPEPHLTRFTPDGPGAVLVCSDGLWNYVEKAAELAAIALPEALANPFGAAERLVRRALDDGGHDNITAVLVPYPVPASAEPAA